MILARVIGNIVSTQKHPSHKGHKIMMVVPIDEKGKEIGASFLSCDSVSAGPNDIVLVEQEGNTAREILGTKNDPFHSVIVGIVDRIDL